MDKAEKTMGRDEKKNAVFTIAVIAAIILVFTAADLLNGDRSFSETENRLLARKPKFSWERLLDGRYTSDMEKYLTDQFVSRDKWIGIKTVTDLSLQKKTINGVYLGADGYLIEQHMPEDYTETQIQKKLLLLQKLAERWDAKVMLVPTADNILTDKLPANAVCFDQKAFLDRVTEMLGEENCVDVYGALKEHAGEDIYYRTDHHWTSLGAWYGYLAWLKTAGKSSYPYDVKDMATASGDFQGTLQAKVKLDWGRDSIQYFPETARWPLEVTYDMQTTTDTLYETSYLGTRNKYGFFLDDNHALVEIESFNKRRGTLFVIKDSYANCLIPLLVPHYSKIYVLDLRYYNGRLFGLMENCLAGEPGASADVLVLYNCIHFLDDFMYAE